MKFDEVIPISHTPANTSKTRPNRINNALGRLIAKLYLEKNISEIAIITGKSEEAINNFLTKKNLL